MKQLDLVKVPNLDLDYLYEYLNQIGRAEETYSSSHDGIEFDTIADLQLLMDSDDEGSPLRNHAKYILASLHLLRHRDEMEGSKISNDDSGMMMSLLIK